VTRPGQDGRVDEPMRKPDSQPPAADVVLEAVLLDGTRYMTKRRDVQPRRA